MAVNEDVSAYSVTAASNTPDGGDTVGPDLDNHLRDIKKNIRNAAQNFIGTTDENFKGRIKATTSGSTHTLSYWGDTGDMEIVAVDDSASAVTPYIDDVLMGTVPKNFNKETNTGSALAAIGLLEPGIVGNQLFQETETASARARLDLGTAAIEDVGTSIGNVAEYITGSATSGAALPAVSGEFLSNLDTRFTKEFTSAEQTISSAATRVLAHNLSATPTVVTLTLVNKVGDGGFTAGDKVDWFIGSDMAGLNSGVIVWLDATNINVRYGSRANVFNLLNKTTGANFNATNSSWRTVWRAWV